MQWNNRLMRRINLLKRWKINRQIYAVERCIFYYAEFCLYLNSYKNVDPLGLKDDVAICLKQLTEQADQPIAL